MREHSPFYKKLYQALGPTPTLAELPVLDQDAFWQAANAGQLLTGPQKDGIVFKSGGTTGSPKFSIFTQAEWDEFTKVFGLGILQSGMLKASDRVANIFYAGQLYASFIFIMRSLEQMPLGIVQYPLGGATPIDEMIATLEQFEITVLAGVPTSIMQIMARLKEQSKSLPALRTIIYGGEAMYEDQLLRIKAVLPAVQCHSIGWASVDGGMLGYVSPDCSLGEHRTFGSASIMEIVDPDTHELIREKGVIGKVLLTNLTRELMPIIRYPAGDMAMWVEDEGAVDRKLKIMGRSNEGARVGPATLYLEDVRNLLTRHMQRFEALGFQLVLSHFDHKDCCDIVVGIDSDEQKHAELSSLLLEDLLSERKMLKDLIKQDLIHPLKLSFVSFADLERNPRTGKLKQVIDRRL